MVQTFIQTLTYSAHKFCAQESNVKVQKHIYPWIQMSLPQKQKWPTSYFLVRLMTCYVSQSTMLHIPLKTTQKLAENCAGVFPVYEGLPKSTSDTKSHTKPSKHQETHDHKLGHSESATQAYLLTITRGSLSKKKKKQRYRANTPTQTQLPPIHLPTIFSLSLILWIP